MDPLAGSLKRLRDSEDRLKRAEEEWERLSASAHLVFHQGAHEPFAAGPLLGSAPVNYGYDSERATAAMLKTENNPDRVIIPERGDILATLVYADNSERRLLHAFEIDWADLKRKRGAKQTHWIQASSDRVTFTFQRVAPDIYRFAQPPYSPSNTPLAKKVGELAQAFRTQKIACYRSGASCEQIAKTVDRLQDQVSYAAELSEKAASAFKHPRT